MTGTPRRYRQARRLSHGAHLCISLSLPETSDAPAKYQATHPHAASRSGHGDRPQDSFSGSCVKRSSCRCQEHRQTPFYTLLEAAQAFAPEASVEPAVLSAPFSLFLLYSSSFNRLISVACSFSILSVSSARRSSSIIRRSSKALRASGM